MSRQLSQLRDTAAALWIASIERPTGQLIDGLRFHIDRCIARFFFGNPVGRWLYNHTTPNDWTLARFYTSWVPMMLMIHGHPLWAVATSLLIWSTDVIDGWLAKTKQMSTDAGAVLETIVDTIFLLQTFIAVFTVYTDVRPFLLVAASLEPIRLVGGLILRRYGYDGAPNRSGRVKTWAYVIGISLRVLWSSTAAHLILGIGIGLSAYSITMHFVRFRTQRTNR